MTAKEKQARICPNPATILRADAALEKLAAIQKKVVQYKRDAQAAHSSWAAAGDVEKVNIDLAEIARFLNASTAEQAAAEAVK